MKTCLGASNLVFIVLVAVVLSIEFFGCAASQTQLTEKECASVFPWADDCAQFKDSNGRLYFEAWYRGYGDDPDQFLGYIFLRTFPYKKNSIKILAGISSSGKISNIVPLETSVINREFLSQFIGKSLRDSFEIAKTPDDLLFVPSKIKPMRENIPLSEKIANVVKEIIISAESIPAR